MNKLKGLKLEDYQHESDKAAINIKDGKIATLAILFRFSFTAYTLSAFDFVVNNYYPTTVLF